MPEEQGTPPVPQQTPPSLNGPPELEHRPLPIVGSGQSRHHTLFLIIAFVVILAGAVGATWYLTKNSGRSDKTTTNTTSTNQTNGSKQIQTNVAGAGGLELNPAKNYGDKYADGLLPVGDNKYVTDKAKKGHIYACNANFVPASQAGAQTRGPWFTNNNTQWDSKKKAAVAGNIMWDQDVTIKIENGKRVVTTNDLPDHHTGVFPVAASDPAKAYDANPNTISAQNLVYSLTASPTYGTAQCIGGEVGVMINGVALFSAFDAGGRDAGAWEVQDTCDGHPQNKGGYHYHTLSRCIKDTSVSSVIGFALDGFPITGPKVGDKNILTTDDLDECHGIVSKIILDGKEVTTYHYVMTQDFPYSVSCYRATAIKPPGQPETTNQSQQTPPANAPNQQGPPPKP